MGEVNADQRNVEFADSLFVQHLPRQVPGSSAGALTVDQNPIFLKWFKWRSRYEVNFTFSAVSPFNVDANRIIWDFRLLGQGDGRGPASPVFKQGKMVYK